MEEETSPMQKFLTDFKNKQNNQSPTSEEVTRIGNYDLDPEELTGHVIDWVLNYLDNRKCPYSLAVPIAKAIAQQISASFSQRESGDPEKFSDASTLYAEAIGKISAVCETFSSQANLESTSSPKYATSVFAIKNKRRKMEDKHVVIHDLNALLDLKDAPYQSYYAVFDGHSGIDAACYASAQLHINIGKHPSFLSDTPTAIAEGFRVTDSDFSIKCSKSNIKSGCTAICAIVRDNTVFLSWLGDSQAVLVKGGIPVTVTSPHKPHRADERERVEKLGGHITHIGTLRVNGLLAITRAIGDSDQKPYISSEPELDIIQLDGTEDFLILACDGLWDGMSPEDATGVLYRYLSESSVDEALDSVAAKLVHQSKLQGSEDNITAIVVFLRDINEIKESATQFLSNPLHCVQSHDFMAINGNTRMFSMDLNSDISYAKPTVLELNAASSKKLKNAANVMSSAGFGSASYSYQYAENPAEASYQTMNSSALESSQSAYMSETTHTASCFAPEATALSELPTPPIDDMLASQQFENFCSTDLYKELQSDQTSAVPHIVDSNTAASLNLGTNTHLSPKVDVSSQPAHDNLADSENMSLFDTKNNPDTISNSELSADEAVGIASSVVSSTIEAAVKCLADATSPEEPVTPESHTKLNPYAKPFVMKSFFSAEQADPMSCSFIGNNLEEICVAPDTTVQDEETSAKLVLESRDSLGYSCESMLIEELKAYQNSEVFCADLNQSAHSENTLSDMSLLGDNFGKMQIDSQSNPFETTLPVSSDNVVMPQLAVGPESIVDSNIPPVPSEKELVSENQKLFNISGNPFYENDSSFYTHTESKHELIVESVTEGIDKIEASQSVKSIEKSSFENAEEQPEAGRIVQAFLVEHTPLSFGDLPIGSKETQSEVIEAEIISKCEEIQKSIVDSVGKNGSELHGLVEPISLIDIKDDFIPMGAEVPSDPSAEDSRVVPIAVDLASLPEGIPEAEGVTEDSDSEKDGGWSYMKGNVAGSKSKSDEKTLKSAKSNVISKTNRGLLRPNLGAKNKAKNNVVDKTKSISADKTKSISVDKTKHVVADRTKNVATLDKNKALASTDKTKRVPVEKKPEAKATKVFKSSTLSTIAKVSSDKSSKTTSASSTKTGTDIPKTTSSVARPTRPTTLQRTTTPVTKVASTTATDRSAASKAISTTATDRSAASTRVAARSKIATLPENKPGIKTNVPSTLSKGPSATSQSKSSTLATRTTAARPTSGLHLKTSTIAKSTMEKSPASKQASTTTYSRKPVSATMKKLDVKEAKDNVNKQILAKKSATSRVESSSTLTNRRVVSANNRLASSRVPNAPKTNVGKKDVPVPKTTAAKSEAKNAAAKVSQDACKSKENTVESVQSKTDEAKNNLNIECDQKNAAEAAQVVEEKFILETSDKEMSKETGEFSNDKPVVVENGGLTHPPLPNEVAESNPENL